jgi:hypothetical protein
MNHITQEEVHPQQTRFRQAPALPQAKPMKIRLKGYRKIENIDHGGWSFFIFIGPGRRFGRTSYSKG